VGLRLTDCAKKISLGVFVGFLFSHSVLLHAIRLKEAHEFYHAKHYKDAAEGFLEKELDDPEKLSHVYNRAVSQYRAGQYEQAKQGFEKVVKNSHDTDLSKKARFNQGNAAYRLGNYKKSVESFQKILQKHPAYQPAKENLVFVKKIIEQQKKKEKQSNFKDDKKEVQSPPKQQAQNASEKSSQHQAKALKKEEGKDNDPPQNTAKQLEKQKTSDQKETSGLATDRNKSKEEISSKNTPTLSQTTPQSEKENKKTQQALQIIRSVEEMTNRYKYHKKQGQKFSGKNKVDW